MKRRLEHDDIGLKAEEEEAAKRRSTNPLRHEEQPSGSDSDDSDSNPEEMHYLSKHVCVFPNKSLTEHGNVLEGKILGGFEQSRSCAIKVSPSFEQIARESSILLKLSTHTHIVTLNESGKCPSAMCEQWYIALEKCHKWNLRQYFLNLPVFDINRAFKFCRQIIDGMTFVHEKLIIHKDLKPSNILLTQDLESIKIADFGSSQVVKTTSSMVYCQNMFGTLGFRPPESFGGSYASLKSDSFSLGSLFYFILSDGESPFGNQSELWDHSARMGTIELGKLKVPNPKATEHLFKLLLSHERQRRPTIEQIRSHPCWNGAERDLNFDYGFEIEQEDMDVAIKKEIKDERKYYEQDDLLRATLEIYFKSRDKDSAKAGNVINAANVEVPNPFDLDLPPPEDIKNADITLEELLCEGYFTHFYKGRCLTTPFNVESPLQKFLMTGTWKKQTVCVEVTTGTDDDFVVFHQRKLRALTDLRHKNINRLFAKTTDEPLSLVMEFTDAGNLRSHLIKLKSTLTLSDHLNFSCQVANGMTYLSKKNYIHGCLCAESVLVRSDGVLKVAKFRLCRKIGEVVEGWRPLLRVMWTAPEVLESGHFSQKSDVWSFGVVLYEIFSNGLFPYGTVPSGRILNFLRSGNRLKKPEGCPKSIYEKMQKCWEWDREARPEIVELQGYLEGFKND